MSNYGDYQIEIYFQGLSGVRSDLPMTYGELEARAAASLSPELLSYVAGGAGNEHTQRLNVEAFDRWGLMPRMLRGAAERADTRTCSRSAIASFRLPAHHGGQPLQNAFYGFRLRGEFRGRRSAFLSAGGGPLG